jgi:hypothetical protein
MDHCRDLQVEAEALKKQKRREYGIQYRANKRAQLLAERPEEQVNQHPTCSEMRYTGGSESVNNQSVLDSASASN